MTIFEFMSDSPFLTAFIVVIIGMTLEAIFKTLLSKKKEQGE